jgi:hypothetical protein
MESQFLILGFFIAIWFFLVLYVDNLMGHFARWTLETPVTLGFLCYLLVVIAYYWYVGSSQIQLAALGSI